MTIESVGAPRGALPPRATTGAYQAGRVTSFTRAELESFRGAELPDLIGPGVRSVFVGINPGGVTAARQIHFGNPANRFRFRPALVAASLVDEHPTPAPRPIDHNTTLTAACECIRREPVSRFQRAIRSTGSELASTCCGFAASIEESGVI